MTRARMTALIASFISLVSFTSVLAQVESSLPFPWEGEVTGTNVYVRSGAGVNWYPITKLNTGDRVLVLGEKLGWYQIAPPPGSFSFIDKAAVERRPGEKRGVVTQDKVYVRAGSHLDESKRSATQLVLNKGAEVEIIGEGDGFYRIIPPPDATLFISRQFVKPVAPNLRTGLVERHVSGRPSGAGAPDQTPESDVTAGGPGPAARPSGATPVPSSEPSPAGLAKASPATPTGDGAAIEPETMARGKPPGPAGGAKRTPSTASRQRQELAAAPVKKPSSRHQATLTMLEAELNRLLQLPLEEQNLAPLKKRYETIAMQKEEIVPAEIARIRIRQINDRMELRRARNAMLLEERAIDDYRTNMDERRKEILRRKIAEIWDRYDLEGELRKSLAFPTESRRYRLVDSKTQVTIAYVDIPTSVDANPEHLIGSYVGINIEGSRFSPAAGVPIAVAKSLTDLSRRKAAPPPPGDTAPEPAAPEPEPGDDGASSSSAAGARGSSSEAPIEPEPTAKAPPHDDGDR